MVLRCCNLIFDYLDGAFEVDAARALHEHDVAGGQILEEPAACGFGVGQEKRGDAARAGGGGQVLGVALDADNEVEPGLGGGEATGGVEIGAMLALFQHLAGHQDAAKCGAGGESANHGAQRLGVGVVAVVEDRGAGDFDDLATLVSGGERLECGYGRVQIGAGFKRDGETGHGVRRVVLAKHVQGEAAFAVGGTVFHMQAGKVFKGGNNLRVGTGAFAEVDDAAIKIAAKLRDVRVATVEECNAVGGQRGHKLELGAGDSILAFSEVLNVRGADVGDDTPVGCGDACQRLDFASVVHADRKSTRLNSSHLGISYAVFC